MPSEFSELIARLRAGDARAAEELFQRYERPIRLEVRQQMRDQRLRRSFESVDVCQSVFCSFFVRAALGQYDLDNPAEVINLLIGMTRNKVAEQARKQSRQCRNYHRVEPLGEGALQVPGADPSPSEVVSAAELHQTALRELSEEERQLAERRKRDESWEEIATAMGGTAQSRRQQLHRAINRVTKVLGLGEENHD